MYDFRIYKNKNLIHIYNENYEITIQKLYRKITIIIIAIYRFFWNRI